LLVAAAGAAVIVVYRCQVTPTLLDAAGSRLLGVVRQGVGVDNLDAGLLARHGIPAYNVPDYCVDEVATHTAALALALERRVVPQHPTLAGGRFDIYAGGVPRRVNRRTLGIVGFGRIGQAVARRATGFDMEVLWYDPPIPAGAALPGRRVDDLDELLAASDFVSLHVNLSDETRHLMNAQTLRRMRPSAVLVNAARGPVIDEAALAEALDEGVLFAAGLDVFEREPEVDARLRQNARVVLAPHLGSATVDTRAAMGSVAVSNVLAAWRGERPPTLVNPAVWDAPGRRRPPAGR
jgi:phosphoglycerate dehydrogenase-like enzyme